MQYAAKDSLDAGAPQLPGPMAMLESLEASWVDSQWQYLAEPAH